MNRTRSHPRRRLALAVGAGALLLGGSGDAGTLTSNPYWIDHISVCSDPCPSMVFENCRCVKLDPVVIVVE